MSLSTRTRALIPLWPQSLAIRQGSASPRVLPPSPPSPRNLTGRKRACRTDFASSSSDVSLSILFIRREQGAVTRVRTQYQCNSCWAHVAAQEIESAWIIAGHKANLMSVEEIFSCLGSQDYAGARPVCSTGGASTSSFSLFRSPYFLLDQASMTLASSSLPGARAWRRTRICRSSLPLTPLTLRSAQPANQRGSVGASQGS